jgi:hypothetical protein
MFRLILYFFLGYLVWRVVQIVVRIMSNARSDNHQSVHNGSTTQQTTATPFSNVKDADFEDLPPTKGEKKDQPG